MGTAARLPVRAGAGGRWCSCQAPCDKPPASLCAALCLSQLGSLRSRLSWELWLPQLGRGMFVCLGRAGTGRGEKWVGATAGRGPGAERGWERREAGREDGSRRTTPQLGSRFTHHQNNCSRRRHSWLGGLRSESRKNIRHEVCTAAVCRTNRLRDRGISGL